MAVLLGDERDRVVRELTRHCGDGRLTLDELEERIEEAYAAETPEALQHVLRELPSDPVVVAEAQSASTLTVSAPVKLPPLPKIDLPPRLPAGRPLRHDNGAEKALGTLFTIGGFVLLFNGMFWLALICWFVLPGLVLKSKRCG